MNNKNENGRSMVEMLGVLAVIGVLSIGGITGYRAAMDRISLNRVYQLIDTVAMAAAVERQNSNSNSFFNETGLTGLERAQLFCDSYGSDFCDAEKGTEENFYLTNTFFGNHPLNGSTSDSSGKLLWHISRYDSAPSSCYCKSDVVLTIYNINSGICDDLVDVVIDRYDDGIVGFVGSNMASVGLSNDEIKKILCYRDGEIEDKTTSIQFGIVFPGSEESACGACKAARCPCLND